MSNYITEAFKAMNLLESEDVALNADGVEELKGFMSEAGVDPDEEMVDVYDLEAEAQDELKQSYIGKVVLECSVCHSDIFVDKTEIDTDVEGEGYACKYIECPYCMSNEGYTIIGEVAPFNAEKSEELIDSEDEEEIPAVDVEGAVDDVDEEDLEESLNECGSAPKNNKILGESENYNLRGEYIFRNDSDDKPIGRFYNSDGSYSLYDGHEDEDEEEIKTLVHESMKCDGKEELYKDQQLRGVDALKGTKDLEGSDEIRGPIHKTHMNEKCGEDKIDESFESDAKACFEDTLSLDDACKKLKDKYPEMSDSELRRKISTEYDRLDESLKESIEDVTVTTEDETMTMTTKEDGGVVVETSPVEEPIDEMPLDSEEMIVPITDNSEEEIEAAVDANTVEDGEDNIDYEELAEDEFPLEDEYENFDEESFNGLGESYLKSCYENVKCFKTTGVSRDNNKLMIEGIIKFDSGNIKETSFTFESVKPGRYEGYNKHISRGNKTFKLNTSVNNKTLVCESLNYNYRSKNENNESVRVYGTVKRK